MIFERSNMFSSQVKYMTFMFFIILGPYPRENMIPLFIQFFDPATHIIHSSNIIKSGIEGGRLEASCHRNKRH